MGLVDASRFGTGNRFGAGDRLRIIHGGASKQPWPTTAAKNNGMSGMSGISRSDITVTSTMQSNTNPATQAMA